MKENNIFRHLGENIYIVLYSVIYHGITGSGKVSEEAI